MKNLKTITGIALMAILSLTSCQSEMDTEQGDNPNSANSVTASNLKRASMYDGSFDDFLDGVSCSSIILPLTARVNNTQVSIVNQSDYQQVTAILAQYNDDEDSVVFQFPIRVKLSNYTEVTVTNQTEYNTLINACETAENTAQAAIKCFKINFPITILTFNLSAVQSGSLVIASENQLYSYLNSMRDDELFTVAYPMSLTLSNGTTTSIASDLELQLNVTDCIAEKAAMIDAKEKAEVLERVLVNGLFKVESFVNGTVNTASNYAGYTINFANDLTVNAVNSTATTVNGTYAVASSLDVFLNLNFSSTASFNLLNKNWKVSSFTTNTITLQSTTNAAATLVLKQI